MSGGGDTLGSAWREAAHALRAAGIAEADLDARLLIAHAAGVATQDLTLHPDRRLDTAAVARAAALVARRAGREPVGRILGRRGFWTLSLALGPDTLEPRPDSETVIEAVLAAEADRTAPLRILDLGTGTGCLLLALLAEFPAARGIGVDLSPGAVAVAAANAADNGLDRRAIFRNGNWGEGLDGPFDLVVSNPPYIPAADLTALAPEVRGHDPALALDGGEDGLAAYRALLPDAARLLRAGGLLVLEVGIGQAPAVAALVAAAGFHEPGVFHDLGGVARCVAARRRGVAET